MHAWLVALVVLGLHGKGVVKFDGRRSKQLFKSPTFVMHIVPARDAMWIGSTLMVHRLRQGKLDEKQLIVPLHLRVSPTDVPWIGNQQDVSWFDGTWHALPLPGAGTELLHDLEIDDQGRVWILFGDKLLYTTGTGWTTFVAPPQQDVRFCKLATRGDLYLACWQDIFRLSSNTWSSVAKLDKVSATEFVVGADALYIVASRRLHVIPTAGDPFDFEIPNWNVRAFTVDGRGRMWFGTDDGLTVFDRTGKKLALPKRLATKEPVHSILVEGDGPAF